MVYPSDVPIKRVTIEQFGLDVGLDVSTDTLF
jgi:hypothetical protein